MSRHDDTVYLLDMLEHAELAVVASRGRSRADLDKDLVYGAACERFIQIIGEAAKHVSTSFCDAHPEIPWRKIIGTRNLLVHGYASIDRDILWDILEVQLPTLIADLSRVIGPRP